MQKACLVPFIFSKDKNLKAWTMLTHSVIVLLCVLWSEKLWMQSGKSICEENNKFFFNFLYLGWLKVMGTFWTSNNLTRSKTILLFYFLLQNICHRAYKVTPFCRYFFPPKKKLCQPLISVVLPLRRLQFVFHLIITKRESNNEHKLHEFGFR